MKVAISYPPLNSVKGTPCLAQNRQFQWFSRPTYIYPVIPAYGATLLKKAGYEVIWDDAIAKEQTFSKWKERILTEKPDLVAIETKTPVIKRHWKIIDQLKEAQERYNSSAEEGIVWNLKVVLMGDHVTASPEESLNNSKVDYVIASGDFDFMLLCLANHLSKGDPLEGGFWYRQGAEIRNTGSADLSKHELDTLPIIDRELTQWQLYAYKNGNFKHAPGAYMMSARDCWWGRCTFCSWTTLFPGKQFRTRRVEKALDEVGALIKLGAREIMDDSGSFPVGEWLEDFCRGMIQRGYNEKVMMSCNMRVNGIKDAKVWQLMKKAGFRLILFGLESANQESLDKINKNLKIKEIEPVLKMCKEAGLEPHITAMIGYPWETKEMAEKTIDLAKDLFKKGYVDTLQATIVIPYPGTPLYEECKEKGLLLIEDYSHFDQSEQVMKTPLSDKEGKELIRRLYRSFLTPSFIIRKFFFIRGLDDIKFLWRAGGRVWGHLVDFSAQRRKEKC